MINYVSKSFDDKSFIIDFSLLSFDLNLKVIFFFDLLLGEEGESFLIFFTNLIVITLSKFSLIVTLIPLPKECFSA